MNSAQLDSAFFALADPTRRMILARLRRGEASVSELAEPFDMTFKAVSKHIQVLEQANLVTRSRDGQRRPSKIELAPLMEIDHWLDEYRQLWEDRLDRLDDAIDRFQKESKT